jgi:hypothetical protein
MLLECRGLRRAIGIGIDASSKVTGRQGGSEDFYALEVAAWTPELEERAQELKGDFGPGPSHKHRFCRSYSLGRSWLPAHAENQGTPPEVPLPSTRASARSIKDHFPVRCAQRQALSI